MRDRVKRLTVAPTLAALIFLTLSPNQVAAAPDESSVQGLLLGSDNRPASGHRVLLIDDAGTVVAAAGVDRDGMYDFERVSSGNYALGVETPEGGLVRVQAPPVRLAANQIARRDVKLMNAGGNRDAAPNSGMSAWWGGLSTMAKVWTIVGILVAGGLVYSALDDDETSASPFAP